MSLLLEKIYPYFGGAISAALWWYLGLDLPSPPELVLSSSLTLGAILTGFLATSKTILISLRGTEVMESLKESTYIDELVSYIAQAVWLSFAFSVLAIVGLFMSSPTHVFSIVWIFFAIASGLAFIRVTNVILKIIKH